MSRLSPEAEQLVRAGRSALRSSDADRERVFGGLLQREAGNLETEQGMQEPSHTPAAVRATPWKIMSMVVGLGVAGAGLFFTVRPQPPASRQVPGPAAVSTSQPAPAVLPVPSPPVDIAAAAPTQPVSAPPSLVGELREESLAATPRVPPVRSLPSKPRSADSLADEVALLSRASVELHAARPAAALEVLDEHERRFPKGLLTQERAAARVRALCALGRTEEARAELARLARTDPGSPHLARWAQGCASTPSPEHDVPQ